MSVRRVVTEEVDGRSRVATDGAAPHSWCDEIWLSSPQDPLGSDPGNVPRATAVPSGTTLWRMVSLPPDSVMRAALAAQATDGVDADGHHRTKSIDHVFILDGPVELELDEGSVMLEPGDCVVQRETNHAWHNHGAQPIRMLVVMTGTP
jgi:mannose-6-phosphate isomerase-like protein (cupin superfamily)